MPQSPRAGRAGLDLGWCSWHAVPPDWAAAARAFQSAAERLPHSQLQLEARLKWADCQFETRRFTGALSNYWLVATNYGNLEALTNNTVVQALYQAVQCGVEAGDLAAAAEALSRLSATAPLAEVTERAQLLLGRAYERQAQAGAAKMVFTDFLRRHTNSALIPEARLGLARAYERSGEIATAIKS